MVFPDAAGESGVTPAGSTKPTDRSGENHLYSDVAKVTKPATGGSVGVAIPREDQPPTPRAAKTCVNARFRLPAGLLSTGPLATYVTAPPPRAAWIKAPPPPPPRASNAPPRLSGGDTNSHARPSNN